MDDNISRLSFIGMVDFTADAIWKYISPSVHDLLGFETHELLGRPSLALVHPDEGNPVRRMHRETIHQDKAAALAYLRLRHKDPFKGFILCAVSRTIVHNVVVGSVSYANLGPTTMQSHSTAQEITVITPSAQDFQFRRWNDPSPMPPTPVPRHLMPEDTPSPRSPTESEHDDDTDDHSQPSPPPRPRSPPLTYPRLAEKSKRVALVLDRFSLRCPIEYCSNDYILETTTVLGRSFYDFVAPEDEVVVRQYITTVKSWGVNERGQPADGGFGYGKFAIYPQGRDSSGGDDPGPSSSSGHSSRRSRPAHGGPGAAGGSSNNGRSRPSAGGPPRSGRPMSQAPARREHLMDAIMSAHSDGIVVILRPAAQTQAS